MGQSAPEHFRSRLYDTGKKQPPPLPQDPQLSTFDIRRFFVLTFPEKPSYSQSRRWNSPLSLYLARCVFKRSFRVCELGHGAARRSTGDDRARRSVEVKDRVRGRVGWAGCATGE